LASKASLEELQATNVGTIDSVDVEMDIDAFVASLFESDTSTIPHPNPESPEPLGTMWAGGDPLSGESPPGWDFSTTTTPDSLFPFDFDTLITDSDIWSLLA